jgi:DNA replication and repair protein RecF
VIQTLKVTHFRCFATYELSFDRELTIIMGPNGSGKTSLLEALHYLCYLRSFRTHHSQEMIQESAQAAHITLEGTSLMGEVWKIHAALGHEEKRYTLNEKRITSYKDLLAHLRIITLRDEDIFLIKGSPENRRAFLDDGLSLQSEEYRLLKKSYAHLLAQRNQLIRSAESVTPPATYDIWTEKIWNAGRKLHAFQKEYVASLNRSLFDYMGAIMPNHYCSIELCQHLFYATDTFEQFFVDPRHLFQAEHKMRRTLFGPHLDDLIISFDGKPARYFASRGQQKGMAAILRLCQAQTLSEKPVWILDDYSADLDAVMAQRIFTEITKAASQVVMALPINHPTQAETSFGISLDAACFHSLSNPLI